MIVMPCFVKKITPDQFAPEKLKFEPICDKGGFESILREFTTNPEKIIKDQDKVKHEFGSEKTLKAGVAEIDATQIASGVLKVEKYHGLTSVDVISYYQLPEEKVKPLVDIYLDCRKVLPFMGGIRHKHLNMLNDILLSYLTKTKLSTRVPWEPREFTLGNDCVRLCLARSSWSMSQESPA